MIKTLTQRSLLELYAVLVPTTVTIYIYPKYINFFIAILNMLGFFTHREVCKYLEEYDRNENSDAYLSFEAQHISLLVGFFQVMSFILFIYYTGSELAGIGAVVSGVYPIYRCFGKRETNVLLLTEEDIIQEWIPCMVCNNPPIAGKAFCVSHLAMEKMPLAWHQPKSHS